MTSACPRCRDGASASVWAAGPVGAGFGPVAVSSADEVSRDSVAEPIEPSPASVVAAGGVAVLATVAVPEVLGAVDSPDAESRADAALPVAGGNTTGSEDCTEAVAVR